MITKIQSALVPAKNSTTFPVLRRLKQYHSSDGAEGMEILFIAPTEGIVISIPKSEDFDTDQNRIGKREYGFISFDNTEVWESIEGTVTFHVRG